MTEHCNRLIHSILIGIMAMTRESIVNIDRARIVKRRFSMTERKGQISSRSF